MVYQKIKFLEINITRIFIRTFSGCDPLIYVGIFISQTTECVFCGKLKHYRQKHQIKIFSFYTTKKKAKKDDVRK